MRRVMSCAIDVALVLAATVFALVLREDLGVSSDRLAQLAPYLAMTLFASVLILPASGLSRSFWRYSGSIDGLRVVAVSTAIVLSAVAMGFVFNRLENVARSLPILQALSIILALAGARKLMLTRYEARARRHTASMSDLGEPTLAEELVLVVGLSALTNLYLQSIRELAPGRFKVAGLLGRHDRHVGRLIQGVRVLGTAEQLDETLRDLEVHGMSVVRIVVTVPFSSLSPVARDALLDAERRASIRLDLLVERLGPDDGPEHGSREGSGAASAPHNASFVLSRDERRRIERRPYWVCKRVLDIVLASVLLVALSPLLALVAALVAFDVGFPVIFWQQRPGRHGVLFKLYKFRTMAAAHDSLGQRVPDHLRWKRTGAFLRRYRIDELPQLVNILRGEMSFVGPRPLLALDQPAGTRLRLLVKPGLSGWAQINGGRSVSMGEKVALDLWYMRNASLVLDARILLRTLSLMLSGEHRYDEGKLNPAAPRVARPDDPDGDQPRMLPGE